MKTRSSARRARGFIGLRVEQLEARFQLTASGSLVDMPGALPLPYQGPVTAVGDQLIVAGTQVPSSPYVGVEIYNFDTGQWTTKAFSDHNIGGSVAAVGHEAIFAGTAAPFTLTGGLHGQSNVDIYDADTGQWSTSQLSSARVGMQTAVVGSKAFFVGGIASAGFVAQNESAIDVYDRGSGQWTTASLSTPRLGFATVAVDDKILLRGGLLHLAPRRQEL